MVNTPAFAIGVAFFAAAFFTLAEWRHSRRVKKTARLAFGSAGAGKSWTRVAPLLRVVAGATLAWGFAALWQLDSMSADPGDAAADARAIHHVVVALDVSPSMELADAGPRGESTRGERARDVLRSVLERISSERTRVSIVAFYTSAKPVVVDTFDPDVTANIVDDLPLVHAFSPGKTNLYAAVGEAARLGAAWREGSAALIVVSDGETLPGDEIPALPRSFASVLVLGVGNRDRGVFIDGHSSRQDAASLERLALRLKGTYFDANARQAPTRIVLSAAAAPLDNRSAIDARAAAVLAVAAASLVLSLLPAALALAGGQPRRAKAVWPGPAIHQPTLS